MSAAAQPAARRPPPWRDVRVLRVAFQLLFLLLVAALLLYLYGNVTENLRRLGIGTDFRYLRQPAGFAIANSDFRSSQNLFQALLVGIENTAKVSALGIVLATVLGVVVGVARLSPNWLLRRAAAAYVETLRNIPVLVIILFWYLGVVLRLPPISRAGELLDLVVLSNRGFVVPWFERTGAVALFAVLGLVAVVAAAAVVVWRTRHFDRTGEPHRRVLYGTGVLLLGLAVAYVASGAPFSLSTPERGDLRTAGGYRLTPEYTALLIALVLYTASHIAEIVRGSILAVPRGQGEGADALGLSGFQRLRFVVLPQAFRISVPPIANQYLNLTKNSSLGVVVAYPELTRITQITISQGGPAPQAIVVLMLAYLVFSLTISAITNMVNRRLTLRER